jgi:hypothetical protein
MGKMRRYVDASMRRLNGYNASVNVRRNSASKWVKCVVKCASNWS